MNDNELSILIKAKNEASRVLEQVQGEVKGLSGGIEKAMGKAQEGSTILLGGVAAAGAAVVGFGTAAVAGFMEAQDASAQLAAVIKSTGGAAGLAAEDLQDQASALQSITKFSDEAIMATQSMLLTFTNIKGGVMLDATQTALDMAQALGMEGSQAAMQLGKALNDPAEGLSKLTRVGVTFTAEQEKQVKAMVAAGNAAGAQQVILQELQKEFGGSAEAAGSTFSGQLIILKNVIGDFMEVGGEMIVGFLMPAVQAFRDWLGEIGTGGEAIGMFTNWLEKNRKMLVIITGAIIMGLVPALAAAAAGVWATMAPLIPFLAVGALLGALINMLANRMGGWAKLWETVKSGIGGVFGAISSVLMPALSSLWSVIVNQLWPAMQNLWRAVEPVLIPALKVLGIVLGVVVLAAIWAVINVIKIVISLIAGWIEVTSGIIGRMVELGRAVGRVFGGIVGTIAGALGGVYGAITDPFRRAFDWLWGRVDAVKDHLRKISPFARHSPSLVDLVKSGTKEITRNYADMYRNVGNMAGRTTAITAAAPALSPRAFSGMTGREGAGMANLPAQAPEAHYHVHVGNFIGTDTEQRRFAVELAKMVEQAKRGQGTQDINMVVP